MHRGDGLSPPQLVVFVILLKDTDHDRRSSKVEILLIYMESQEGLCQSDMFLWWMTPNPRG